MMTVDKSPVVEVSNLNPWLRKAILADAEYREARSDSLAPIQNRLEILALPLLLPDANGSL